jgi:hypothetical protein
MITRRGLLGMAAGAAGAMVVPKALPSAPAHPVDALKSLWGRGGEPDSAGEAEMRAYADQPVEATVTLAPHINLALGDLVSMEGFGRSGMYRVVWVESSTYGLQPDRTAGYLA